VIAREINLYFASLTAGDAVSLLARTVHWLLGGGRTQRDECVRQIAQELGASDVRLFGSARGALTACLRAAGIGAGDEVVLAGFTCLAVPTAVGATGARPVYADIDAQTLTTALDAMLKVAGPRTRAVVVQHTFGNPVDEEAIRTLRARGYVVIEDCALAAGSVHAGRPAGCAGDAAFFSLELSKTISTGWGGILAVRDPRIAAGLQAVYAATPEPPAGRVVGSALQTAASAILYGPAIFPLGKYAVAIAFRAGLFKPSTPPSEATGQAGPDFVMRLAPPQAALALRMWKRLPAIRARNERVVARLRQALVECGFTPLASPPRGSVAVANRVPFLVPDRSAAIAWFAAHGIELGAWFDGPLSPPPPAGSPLDVAPESVPVAAAVSRRIVNLPAHHRLSDADVRRIVDVLQQFAAECRRAGDAVLVPTR
jgi:perosamine synthetase